MTFATSEKVKEDRLWDILSRAGKHVVALGVPQTFPPRQVNGEMVSCFLTPSTDSRYTYPEALKDEIREVVGDYMVDVPDYRTDDRERVVRDIHTMTQRRFALARHLRDTRPWDFFMLVEMGTDRLHHALWRFYDPNHPDYVPGTPLEAGVPRLLPLPRLRGRHADRGARRRHGGDGGVRPRRPGHVRRHPDQRVADAERLPDAAPTRRPSRRRSAAARSTGRTRACGPTAATTRASS